MFKLTLDQAESLAREHWGLEGRVVPQVGEVDLNYKIMTARGDYLLKVSDPAADGDHLQFLLALHGFLASRLPLRQTPQIIPTLQGKDWVQTEVAQGQTSLARMHSWLQGSLWSQFLPHTQPLLEDLGVKAGGISTALSGFEHKAAHRKMDWDIAQAAWTSESLSLFSDDKRTTLSFFQNEFQSIQPEYMELRKQVVHNDVNDNNVLVHFVGEQPEVSGIIDFGDAIYTQLINDVAITIAYGMMGQSDIRLAACHIIRGYHQTCPLSREEVQLLYPLIAMRLVISVCKSAEGRDRNSKNDYLQVSDAQAWKLLEQLRTLDSEFFTASLLDACGLLENISLSTPGAERKCSLLDLFPPGMFNTVKFLDLGLESEMITPAILAGDLTSLALMLQTMRVNNPETVFAGRHLEVRPMSAFTRDERGKSERREHRNTHLGMDLWVDPETQVIAPYDCEIIAIHGPRENSRILLKLENGTAFDLLILGLQQDSLDDLKAGDILKRGSPISRVAQHGNKNQRCGPLNIIVLKQSYVDISNIPEMIAPSETSVWEKLSVSPQRLFHDPGEEAETPPSLSELLYRRRKHLGRSLSLSYDEPLHIVRGMGAYLIDAHGQRYLDTVNNVAHVGHEHPRVVAAGQRQMALLNTNTRYIHRKIHELSAVLLETLPEPLSVVHFVNSGSEANELALRMARAVTGHQDIIALERGYHGNTQACIDISSYKFDGKGGQGCPKHTHIVPLPDAFRGLYQGGDTGGRYAGHIQEQIEKILRKGRRPAAYICESIVSCGGQIELPQNYLSLAFEHVRQAGGVCISDEVQVGCGRVGTHFWGFQMHDVVPDIVTIGKPLGNGHPVAAVVCTPTIAEAFANGMEYFNTFGGNPVSCAIGLEVLNVIREENLQQHALDMGTYLQSGLKDLQSRHPIIADVRGKGLFLGVELADVEKKPLTKKASYLANRMQKLGILMSTDGKDNNVLKIKPPMVFSRENAEMLLARMDQVCSETLMNDDQGGA